jgi:predicted ATP-dependent endonuclease of OLD family
MKFDLKNIGPIKEASIKVDGLTIIAGENSIGKSAIGKAIFCLMKGYLETTLEVRNYAKYTFYAKLLEIEELISQKVDESSLDLTFLSIAFDDMVVNPDFIGLINSVRNKLLSISENDDTKSRIIQQKFEDLKTIFKSEGNIDKHLIDKFDIYINNIFKGNINNQLSEDKLAHIFLEGKGITINSNKTQDINTQSMLKKEVTLIETPLILSMYRFIKDSLAFNNNSSFHGLSIYTFDLIKKVSKTLSLVRKDFNDEISQIINGKVKYKNETDDFVYTDNKNIKHDISNVASGIKSFGLLQLLLNSGNLNENSILIIDEPEVHLHPFWQVEYAKILVKLVENNIPVVVASHSPYFIEALKTYSDKTIKDKTNFYLGEMQEGGSVFKDVTNDLEPIFELLAIPMQQLMLDNL